MTLPFKNVFHQQNSLVCFSQFPQSCQWLFISELQIACSIKYFITVRYTIFISLQSELVKRLLVFVFKSHVFNANLLGLLCGLKLLLCLQKQRKEGETKAVRALHVFEISSAKGRMRSCIHITNVQQKTQEHKSVSVACKEQLLVMVSFICHWYFILCEKRWLCFPLEAPLENLMSLRHLEVFTIHFFQALNNQN